ncbi:hypothetical protein EXM22_16445 [Oceanispirochaeta crateris]|uniref:SbsA Ig-like domain-containing protein n=1 Tax=Oceanispirochaeta crateris TaxID=2518645 RepID=A0A5C1QNF9_9SPIO|nr:Ig-like domain-containing protein [Oceanispirochaeta crateris]QEN09493.1 hypothetical protein EXM22_16445 [Oceanispirochaeta crateris]
MNQGIIPARYGFMKHRKMEKRKTCRTYGLLTLLFSIGCSACSLQCKEEFLLEPDLSPPRLLEIYPTDSPQVSILFDEPVKAQNETITLDSGDPALLTVKDEKTLTLVPQKSLIPGRQYKASISVEDLGGNSCRFVLLFWGWNPRVPDLLINEFNPEGSDSNPDCIELYARSEGNTAGMCLYYGTRRFYEYRYVFPDLELNEGDYVIIHCRREFLTQEISENMDMTASGGKLSSDEAWDLWFPEDSGLSGANGILTLYNAPDGVLLDGVVYSDRDPDPENDYLGWTSRTFDAAADLYESGAWEFSNESISPKEAIPSHYTTATRSLCRNSTSFDSNSNADWHTVPTSSKSFGGVNTDEEFVPSS